MKLAIIKTITYRVMGTLFTIISAFIVTGQIDLSAAIGGLELIFKMFAYYAHERLWEKLIGGEKRG